MIEEYIAAKQRGSDRYLSNSADTGSFSISCAMTSRATKFAECAFGISGDACLIGSSFQSTLNKPAENNIVDGVVAGRRELELGLEVGRGCGRHSCHDDW